jgi:hypothetical protein
MLASIGARHGRTARGGYGLHKVSLGPSRAYPSTPCGRVPVVARLRPCRMGGLQPSSARVDTPRRTPMAQAQTFVAPRFRTECN